MTAAYILLMACTAASGWTMLILACHRANMMRARYEDQASAAQRTIATLRGLLDRQAKRPARSDAAKAGHKTRRAA